MAPFVILLLLSLGAAFLGRNRRFGFLGTFLVAVIVSPLVMVLALLQGDGQRSTRHDQKQ